MQDGSRSLDTGIHDCVLVTYAAQTIHHMIDGWSRHHWRDIELHLS